MVFVNKFTFFVAMKYTIYNIHVCGAQTSQFKCYISWELLQALEALVIRNRGRIPGFHKVIEEVL